MPGKGYTMRGGSYSNSKGPLKQYVGYLERQSLKRAPGTRAPLEIKCTVTCAFKGEEGSGLLPKSLRMAQDSSEI